MLNNGDHNQLPGCCTRLVYLATEIKGASIFLCLWCEYQQPLLSRENAKLPATLLTVVEALNLEVPCIYEVQVVGESSFFLVCNEQYIIIDKLDNLVARDYSKICVKSDSIVSEIYRRFNAFRISNLGNIL